MNKRSGDLGPERIPPSRLRYRYNHEKILNDLSKYLEESCKKAFLETKKLRRPCDVYCAIGLPIPEEDPALLGDFPTKVYMTSPRTVQLFSFPTRKWKDSSIYSFGFQAHPHNKDDIVTTVGVLVSYERLNYLPFISEEVGIATFSRDSSTDAKEFRFTPIQRATLKKEAFIPPFKTFYDFLPYYLNVVEAMNKMFVKELYENTNVAVSRISENLVWTRRTRLGKDIRINNPFDITDDLVPWGAFEYFLENNRCWLDQTNCKKCEKKCWPNVIFDIDPGEKISRKSVVDALIFIQKNLDEEGINYNVKLTGKRGFHITAYCGDFKPPEYNYIPLRVLKHCDEMSTKQIKQVIEALSQDPFEVTRDYIRCKTEYWKNSAQGKLKFLVHDFSAYAGNIECITIDASSIKRRGYHRAHYSLTDKKTACLPVCNAGIKIDLELIERLDKISQNPSEILRYENELSNIEVKYNDPSFIKDFLEEYEKKIFEEQFKKVEGRISFIS
jgi:hypothetical protein